MEILKEWNVTGKKKVQNFSWISVAVRCLRYFRHFELIRCDLDQKHDPVIETEMVITHICLCVQPKKKKKPKPQPEACAQPAPPEATPPEDGKDEMNGFHANGSAMDGESLDSLSEQLESASLDAAELDSEPASSETTGNQSFDTPNTFDSINIYSIWMQQHPPSVCLDRRLCFPAAPPNASLTTLRCIEKEEQAVDYEKQSGYFT